MGRVIPGPPPANRSLAQSGVTPAGTAGSAPEQLAQTENVQERAHRDQGGYQLVGERAQVVRGDAGLRATSRLRRGSLGSPCRFGWRALVPGVALGVVLAHVLNAAFQQRYLETARRSATLIGRVGIQPLLNQQQVANGLSSSEIAQVNDKLQGAELSNEVDRIKVWNRAGKIVYSDNPALIGKTLPIDDDLANALAGRPSASLTNA